MTTIQAVALAEELLMHIEDLLDDEGDNGNEGFALKDQDTDATVGTVQAVGETTPEPNAFRVLLADGTALRVTVEAVKL